MDQNNESVLDLDLHIDPLSKSYLSETAKWTKFLSILGLVFCGLLLIGGAAIGTVMSSMMAGQPGAIGSGFFTAIYIGIALLYILPCVYLLRFSTHMQAALNINDGQRLQQAFGSLKSCFKFIGILTIVILAFYVLAIFGGIGAAFMR